MPENWKGKRILITGVTGTVGRELMEQVISRDPGEVIGIDNNESQLFFMGQEFAAHPNVRLYLGDVRDRDKLMRKMAGIDIVLHAAALKHVVLCEESPRDAIQTNIYGVQNVIDSATVNKVGRVIFTSSDKAVNPTNVMGTSKLMGEQLVKAANVDDGGNIFTSTRFGNVLGSRGSVLPVFRRQIAEGGPVTLTSDEMTRFVMTLQEAVDLVLETAVLAKGGDIFITKMKAIRVRDLAEVMIAELASASGCKPKDIEIVEIGPRPGEKLFEELMNAEEVRRSVELERHYAVMPALTDMYEASPKAYPGVVRDAVTRPYNSANEQAMTRDELRAYLKETGLLETGGEE